jgi:hypothetical protein
MASTKPKARKVKAMVKAVATFRKVRKEPTIVPTMADF